jgi:hypothetical protein
MESAMSRLLDFDAAQMRLSYNSDAFGFGHTLHASPLFTLRNLAELAEMLLAQGGTRDVYNAAAGKAFGDKFAPNGARGLRPGEAIEQIEKSNSWMVLKRVEKHPEYKLLVDRCFDELAAANPDFSRDHVRSVEGFIFVTSPGGVTPYHIDPQWSFMAQIRGKKTYRIYDVNDPQIISEQEIEDYYGGNVMAARHDTRKDRASTVFYLEPGMAVNQPLHAPHSAVVGDEVSIGMTVAVVSDVWADRVRLHNFNRRLRSLGMTPHRVGSNMLADLAKVTVYRSAASAVRMTKRLFGSQTSDS